MSPLELDNILSSDIEKARESIKRFSAKVGINMSELPINIDRGDTPMALAYTGSEGIWLSKKVIVQEPENVEIYLAHELFHHVVNDQERTSKFSSWDVNIAEDYSINWHIHRLFGYDVRKLKSGKLLYNKHLGCMHVHKILKYKTKEDYKNGGCGGLGIPHVLILEAARKVRMEHEPWKSMAHTRSLFYLDDVDRRKYVEVLDAVRYKIPLSTLPIDTKQLLEGLWTHAFHDKPVAKLRHGLDLTNTETAAYAWRRDFDTSGDPIISAYTAAKFINNLAYHQAYLRGRVINARARRDRLKRKYDEAVADGKKKLARKLQRKLTSAETGLRRTEERAKWPIERLFKEKPVTRIPATEIPIRAAALRGIDKRKPIAGLPTLRRNETVRELRLLSGVTQRIVQRVKSIQDELDDILDEAPGIPDLHLPGDQRDAPNMGNEVSPAQQKLDQLDTIESNADMLIDILQYMREFEAALAKKRNRNSSDSKSINQIISYGNELEQVELAEFALLAAAPEVQSVFYSKLMNHSLLLYTPPEIKRAPVVIAVDCSGSMMGEPYTTACGFALAMMRFLAQDKRGAALLTFSDSIVKSVVANGKEISMTQCLEVLTNIRPGGTSFSAAMNAAYNIKQNMRWRAVTTMLITDGQSGLNNDVKERLRVEKSADDKLVAVLTSGDDSGLRPFCDDSVVVKRSKLFNELVEQGGQLL